MWEDHSRVSLTRGLRRRCTKVEVVLWAKLRNKQLEGAIFRRQHPVGSYIVDFICLKKRLIVEIDGGQHANAEATVNDQQRTRWLVGQGYQVLRFWNNEVLANTQGVIEVLGQRLNQGPPSPCPLPSRERGRGRYFRSNPPCWLAVSATKNETASHILSLRVPIQHRDSQSLPGSVPLRSLRLLRRLRLLATTDWRYSRGNDRKGEGED